MHAGSTRWRRPFDAHKTRRSTGVVGLLVAVVAGGVLIAATPVRADSGPIGITEGGCAGGGSGFCFTPESAVATTGKVVTWVNSSRANHTVTSCTVAVCGVASPGDAFSLAIGPAFGDNNSFTFASAGTYTYYCKVHGYSAMHGTITVNAKKSVTTQDDNHKVSYDSWAGVADGRASGGLYRTSSTQHATAAFKFTGTGVTWVTRKGPDQGVASVQIDGTNEANVDLYRASPERFSQTYSGLSSMTHKITVTVTGTANPASTGASVAVDAFVVGTTTSQESSPAITYDSWVGATATYASGGTYRYSGVSGSTASLTFTGTRVDWFTSSGPANGIASVSIDGAGQGTVDLYSPGVTWDVVQSYSGLASGAHTIVITALGSKNASSTGTRVVVDAFLVHP